MTIMGMIGGAVWGFIPGFLKAKFTVNEIITTLMLNYVAILWNNFWIFDRWSDAGFQMTPCFERMHWLPRLADYAREYPTFSPASPCTWASLSLGRGRGRVVDFQAQPLGLRDQADRRQPRMRRVTPVSTSPATSSWS